MSMLIVLTVVSDDRPGIVDTLSGILTEHEGNWTESSMMSLAGKFAGILLARVPRESGNAFISAVQALESAGLHIIAQPTIPVPETSGVREFSLDLVGQDRPGIISDITTIIARHSINVEELDTECQSASMSGETLFLARARLLAPADVSLDEFQQELEDLANEMMVDITLE